MNGQPIDYAVVHVGLQFECIEASLALQLKCDEQRGKQIVLPDEVASTIQETLQTSDLDEIRRIMECKQAGVRDAHSCKTSGS